MKTQLIIKYLQLIFTKGLGHKTIKKLIDTYSSVENLFNTPFENLSEKFGKNVAEKVIFSSQSVLNLAESHLEKALENNIEIIIYEDEKYPKQLKQIPDSPVLLFARGNIDLLNVDAISVVGTRNPSDYGKKVANTICEYISNNNIPIVSGGAYGIDTIAHKISLNNNNSTIAVLGTGIDITYPAENKKLFQQIIENGCIVSEFPMGTKPSKFTFPQRNRIIAGLSQATIVIEASKSSGSLITANLANEYGKVVFSVPHNIDNPKGVGCNLLIKEGAIPIISPEDIFEELPFLLSSIHKRNIKIENPILDLIENYATFDELLEKTELDVDTLLEELLILEIEGFILNENGVYKRIKI